ERAMTVFRGILMTWPGRIFALALVGLIAGGAVFVSRANAPAAKTELRTQAVTKGSVIQSVAVSGSVAAMNQTKMTFKSTGKISDIYVSVGQQVTAGQPLAKLDTTDLEAALTEPTQSGSDFRNAINALYAGLTPITNSRASVSSLLSPTLGDYQRSRDEVGAAIGQFDIAMTAASDTSGPSSSFLTAMNGYNLNTSRLDGPIDTTNGNLSQVAGGVTSAQANLNSTKPRYLGSDDPLRADLAALLTAVTRE